MSDLKNKLEEIHKLASTLPDKVAFKPQGRMQNPPGSGTPTGGGGASGGRFTHRNQQGPASTGGGYSPAVGAIKEMQAAIQDFANKVTSYSTDEITGAVRNERKDFNDFVTEQYLATSDVKGVEWDKDPKAVSQVQKQQRQSELLEMEYVIDGLKRIGGKSNELLKDNVWDFRTNNALRNVYAFAYALVNLSKDFGKPEIKTFNDASLSQMNANIPEEDNPSKLPPDEKIAKAKALTPLIKSLTKFYDYYVKKIAMNPKYRGYIEGTYDMYQVKPGGTDPGKMTEEEAAKYQKEGRSMVLNHVVLPTKTGNKPVDINYMYLSDPGQFNKLLESLGYTPNEVRNPEVQKRVLDAIRTHVTALMSGRY